ncbi:6815_t:CDS:2, partial [Gigaspora rosea]
EEAKKNKLVFNENTVGAGLPAVSTLKDLIRTGDDKGQPFSEIDIENLIHSSCLTIVVILGRITGMNLSLDTLPVENIDS